METKERPVIGIIGGVGPYAGLDLAKKVFDNTVAGKDQEHLDLVLINMPRLIPDRTEFLLGREKVNPAAGILECIGRAWAAGARVVGVPCNTAHSEPIFDLVEGGAAGLYPGIQIVHLVREAARAAKAQLLGSAGAGAASAGLRVGLLATPGTYASGIYARSFAREGLELLVPDEGGIARVHRAIYDKAIGIKARSNPVSAEAVELLSAEARILRGMGADLVVMGCTEIPLALSPAHFDFPLLDPGQAFARALIARAAPERLIP